MRKMEIIGRVSEQKILEERFTSSEPELIAMYGRRRVGKTFLVREFAKDRMVFEFTGIHDARMKLQLENFSIALQLASKSSVRLAIPGNWLQAFAMLDTYLETLPLEKPASLFFDEFTWIDSHKSGFLQAFDHWWNASASKKKHLKVIICGSAASWMIDKVINNRGGLHNRVTQTIRLLPFTLGESQEYLQQKGIILDQYSQLQLYMALGGIPYYLRNIHPGESAAQVIERLCFAKDGPLKSEFNNLYRALYANPEHHEKVIRVLASNAKGLTRNEIIQECGLTSGGAASRVLKELEESGFINPHIPFQKHSKDAIYKLSDEYSLFYLKFIEHQKDEAKGAWFRTYRTPVYTSWSGLAFESVCQKHILQVRRRLGIEGVVTQASAWRHHPRKGEQGAQIDMLLDRQDRCINICEMKFSETEFVIDKKYADELRTKVNVFRDRTASRKTMFLTMITTYGTRKNEHYLSNVQAEIVMGDLFT